MAIRTISMGAIIAIAVTGLFLTVITTGGLTSSQSVPSGGTITSVFVGVYTDSTCTQNCTSIDWGGLAPGASTTRAIYVKNTGTVPVTLSMTTTSWVPSNANTYLTVTWNRETSVLAAGSSVSAILTLTASASAGSITTFSFNIVISGTQ
jgi:hypothetical protein